ncbi:MAG: VOC family protein [Parvibaculum sp.]
MPQSPATPLTLGAHHVGLTVPNLTDAANFFTQTLGFAVIAEKADYPALFVSDGTTMITLWQAVNGKDATPFNRKTNIGLHHIAFKVADANALRSLYGTLQNTPKVKIEFAPEPLGASKTQHFMCTIPGDIRVEFIAPAA